MKKTFILLLAIIIGSITVLSGCFGNKKDVIVVNEVTRSVFYAPLYIAMTEGFFEEEGLKIELYTGEGADKSMISLITGAADIGLMGVEAAVYISVEGKQNAPKVFGQLTKRDGSFLVGREYIENFDWRTHLEGKEVLVGRPGGMPAMTFEYAVNQIGLFNGENITLNFDIPFPNLGPSFLGNNGDFVNLFEPVASSVVQNNVNAYKLGAIGELAGEVPFTAFMATENYLTKNPEKIDKFLKALQKAYNFLITQDVDTVAVALKKTFKTTSLTDLVNTINSYKEIDAWSSHPAMTEDSFNRLIEVMKNAKQLTATVEMNTIVDNTFANKITAE